MSSDGKGEVYGIVSKGGIVRITQSVVGDQLSDIAKRRGTTRFLIQTGLHTLNGTLIRA